MLTGSVKISGTIMLILLNLRIFCTCAPKNGLKHAQIKKIRPLLYLQLFKVEP